MTDESVLDSTGQLVSLSGALLPAGYQLDTTYSSRPWVCPVRTCRKAHCKMHDLGFHFQVRCCSQNGSPGTLAKDSFYQRAHFAAVLNDNGDGTFSVRGAYRSRSGCIEGTRILKPAIAIVVSREALGRDSPLPKVQLPDHLVGTKRPRPSHAKRENRTAGTLKLIENTPGSVKSDSVKPIERKTLDTGGGAEDLWTYVQARLVSTTDIPQATAIQLLLSLPRRRDVQYNKHRRRVEFAENGSRDIAAMIIQVTGDHVPDMCTRCRKGKGPFQGCVVVSQSAHEKAQTRYPCCANCLFGGKKPNCSLKSATQKRWYNPGRALPAEEDLAPEVSRAEDPRAASRDSEPLIQQDNDPRLTRSHATQGPMRARPALPPAGPSRQRVSKALVSQGTLQDQDALELEDWEIAPGRIRETTAASAESTLPLFLFLPIP